MNRVISDTAEYGCYLFDHACKPLLANFMTNIETRLIGKQFSIDNQVDNKKLIAVNQALRNHPIEKIGATLRTSMSAMQKLKK
jgi:ketol-acid reductoisomerase